MCAKSQMREMEFSFFKHILLEADSFHFYIMKHNIDFALITALLLQINFSNNTEHNIES